MKIFWGVIMVIVGLAGLLVTACGVVFVSYDKSLGLFIILGLVLLGVAFLIGATVFKKKAGESVQPQEQPVAPSTTSTWSPACPRSPPWPMAPT